MLCAARAVLMCSGQAEQVNRHADLITRAQAQGRAVVHRGSEYL